MTATQDIPARSPDVVLFGEALALLVADRPGPLEEVEHFTRKIAGAEVNVAIGLARLGLSVSWRSRLGADSMARFLVAAVQREGIDVSHVVCDPAQRTGFQLKGRVSDDSDPPVEYHRKGSAASLMGPDDVEVQWLTSARHLHVTGVFAALSPTTLQASHAAVDAMRAAGRSISFDPNLRPTLWPSENAMREAINRLAAKADWVMPGIEEGRLLTGCDTPQAIASFYRNSGAKIVVVKLGPQGAYYDDGKQSGFVDGCPVEKVVDTVGAGDGFAVGLISGLLAGRSLAEAVARGNWIGARQVQTLGDSEGLPTSSELAQAGY